MSVRNVEDLETLAAGLLGLREGVWFGLSKPPCQVKRRGWG